MLKRGGSRRAGHVNAPETCRRIGDSAQSNAPSEIPAGTQSPLGEDNPPPGERGGEQKGGARQRSRDVPPQDDPTPAESGDSARGVERLTGRRDLPLSASYRYANYSAGPSKT